MYVLSSNWLYRFENLFTRSKYTLNNDNTMKLKKSLKIGKLTIYVYMYHLIFYINIFILIIYMYNFFLFLS